VKRHIAILLVAAACGGAREQSAASKDTTQAPVAWAVRPDSFGQIPLGVPLEPALSTLGDSTVVSIAAPETCTHWTGASMPRGTRLMILRDSVAAPLQVARAEVDSAGVLTAEGVGVGDPESRVLELYSGRVVVQPHKYTGPTGHYLVVTSPRDSMYRIVFETDGQRVVRYRAGRRPAVDFVEGCS
jgi:hypothetical protein